jgi:hypothetical protein
MSEYYYPLGFRVYIALFYTVCPEHHAVKPHGHALTYGNSLPGTKALSTSHMVDRYPQNVTTISKTGWSILLIHRDLPYNVRRAHLPFSTFESNGRTFHEVREDAG